MKRYLKKLITLTLVLGLTVSLLSACSGANNTANTNTKPTTANEDPYDKLPREITINARDQGLIPAGEGNYQENRWTKWINEQSKIKVTFISIPAADFNTKMGLLFASHTAPDIVWEYNRPLFTNFKNQGVLQPVKQLIDKYNPTYRKFLNENPQLKPYTLFDGEEYVYVERRPIRADQCIWIRQDWLEKLNLKAPATDEDLIAVAKAFTLNDPDGNGKNDTYGFGIAGAWQGLLGNAYFANSNYWYNEEGKMVYGNVLDRYQDVINFKKRMYDEGLLDKEFLTDTKFTKQKQLFATGKTGIYLGQYGSIEPEFTDLKKNVPTAKVVPLEMIKTKYGQNAPGQGNPFLKMVSINKDAKNPKACAEYLEWMFDKGWFNLIYGNEGVHYKLEEGVPISLSQELKQKEVSWAGDYPILSQNYKVMTPKNIPLMASSDPIAKEFAQMRAKAIEVVTKKECRRDLPYDPSFQELTDLLAQFRTIAIDLENQAIVAGSKMTAKDALEKIKAEWKRLGGDNVEKQVQQWYDKNKNDLKR